ncbi:hypothetical protein SRABI128_03436 [Microbacterium sp. Bi128]|nr:hypothetical protein SRABI128_03436 [Microbacterium sp. Bi128]
MGWGLPEILLGAVTPAGTAWLVGVGVAATAASVVAMFSAALAGGRVARPAAAVLMPLIAAATVLVATRWGDVSDLGGSVLLAGVALVAAALSLWRLRAQTVTRALFDGGTAVVAVLAVTVFAPTVGAAMPWLIVAAAVLLCAVDAGGLFVSQGQRRHLVWLALAAAVVALWLGLDDAGVATVEAFTLPVAAALLAMAAAEERARRRVSGRSVSVPALISFTGTLVALLPTALAGADDTARFASVGVASIVLLVAGSWVRPARTPDVLPVVVATAGGVGVLTALLVRLARIIEVGQSGGALTDLAVLVVSAGIALAAGGIARRPVAWSDTAAHAAAVVAVVTFVAGEAVVIAADGGPVWRAVVAILVLGAFGALVAWRQFSGDVVAETAVGGAAVLGLIGVAIGIRPVEWMSLAVAAAVLALAAAWRTRMPIAPVLVGVGAAVALVPSAMLVTDAPTRAGVVMAVAALAMIVVLWTRSSPFVLPVVGVASLAVLIAGGIRITVDLHRPVFDVWLLAVTVPFAIAAVLSARRSPHNGGWMPPAAAVVTLAVVSIGTAVRLPVTGGETLRAAATIVMVLAIGVLWRWAGATTVVWSSVGGAALVGVSALLLGGVEPVEVATVPLGAALVAHGVRALRRHADLGSWPALGIGLGLLLVPSLMFDFVADNVLWRIIALGVVALGVLLAGVWFRLQAPVLIGGVVLIVHAVAQLWPWIAALYESVSGLWWLWLGIAGVLLIVVAATYERRIREVKAVALAIRGLR